GRKPGESAAVVAGALGVGVKDFRETVRPAIGDAREPRRHDRRQRSPAEDRQWQAQQRQDGHFDLLRLELLTEIFGSTSDHQPGDKHSDDGKGEYTIETGTDAAEDHLAELHVDEWHHPANREVAVMHRVDRTA